MSVQRATAATFAATLMLAAAPVLAQPPTYTQSGQSQQSTQPYPATQPGQSSQSGQYNPAPGSSSMSSPSSTSGTSVASLTNAKSKLASATVTDSQGQSVGHVKSVKTGAGGTPQQVRIALASNNQTVTIPADQLTYDSSSGTVQAQMSKDQIDSMAKQPSSSSSSSSNPY
ncbi:MAG TPA: hypothetical protein VG843_02560 [Rhizomicrobium sp.]|nr:hypothetical protein [Rhizomicrobium sp.]